MVVLTRASGGVDGEGVVDDETFRIISAHAHQVNLARSARLVEALRLATDGRLSEPDRAEAERVAHQLVGSAGTFGFPQVSDLAAELEHFFSSAAAAPAGVSQACATLTELRRQLEVGPA